MQVKIFSSDDQKRLQEEINKFISLKEISVKFVTQSELVLGEYAYMTISVFHENKLIPDI